MRDVRGLVPMTPPEGLIGWALAQYPGKMERCGLVYETEYAERFDMDCMMDPLARPKKEKMVRVWCSCCEGSTLLNWGRREGCGYGFVLPEDAEGDWSHTVTGDGDECRCPVCGTKVLVRKMSGVSAAKGFPTAECLVMSAGVVGDERLLVLTGWRIQSVTSKAGSCRLSAMPVEAYVFSAGDCALLKGWRRCYGGTAGYFPVPRKQWSQPRKWSEVWGREDAIYGLTPELVADSCLPHCKLDVYMSPRLGAIHYPAAWLRLYQAHPAVEAVLLHGLPLVLDGLIRQAVEGEDWRANDKGAVELPGLDWSQTRPAQILGLNREELAVARRQDWDIYFWWLFIGAKAQGETLSAQDMEEAFALGDDNLDELLPFGQIRRSIRYLWEQLERHGVEPEYEDPEDGVIPDAVLLRDYWTMACNRGRDLNDPAVRWPADLPEAHDRETTAARMRQSAEKASRFRLRRRQLERMRFGALGLLIRPAKSQGELTAEGDSLHHCVGTYAERYAAGRTAIFFIRRKSAPGVPYYTLELDERTLTVRQNRGMRNCARTPEVEEFEKLWLDWLRAGAPRDRQGRPLAAAERGRAA